MLCSVVCTHLWSVCVQATASKTVKESREELVARLHIEQAGHAARLESLKQASSREAA